MSERRTPLLRMASSKAPANDGIGSFYQEHTSLDRYNPRLEFRYANGMRMSIQYSNITDMNFINLEDGIEDIAIYCQDKFIIRIVGKKLGKLYDALHLENVNWVREARDNEQLDEESFYIDLIQVLYIDNWLLTMDKLMADEEKAIKKMEKWDKKNKK